MRKKWIWVLLAICVLTLGLKLWLLPNWYSTNNKNIALTYDAPISDAAFDAMVKEKIGLSTPLSLAKIARFKGLKLGVAGTSTVVIQPKTSVWSLIKLLVRYQREQKLVTILSHWDYNQFQKQLSNQFDWSPVQLGEEIMDPTNHKRWNEQTWLKHKGVDPYNWQAIAIPNSYMFKRTATPNRLKIGMLLQADPTVVFARGRSGRVLNRDTKIASPYNTYLNKGLPIGALCIPSVNAIDSCLFGAEYPYLYFCAKSDLTPQHDFAESLSQHNENARRYHQALNEFQRKNKR